MKKLTVLVSVTVLWCAVSLGAVVFMLDRSQPGAGDARLGIYIALFMGGLAALLWASSWSDDRWPS